jgi:hypothetical protein
MHKQNSKPSSTKQEQQHRPPRQTTPDPTIARFLAQQKARRDARGRTEWAEEV